MRAAAFVLAAVLREALRPPAVWLALIGAAVVGATFLLPGLATFAAAWHYPAALTLAAWVIVAATQVDPATYRRARLLYHGADTYLVRALVRRDALASQLAQIRSPHLRAEVAAMVQSMDRDLLPELEARVRNFRTLEQHLAQLRQGQGPFAGASPESVAALQRAAEGQRKALDGLMARLSDMNVNLMGLRQEIDQGQLVERAAGWANDLAAYWRATEEVFTSGPASPNQPRPER